MKTTLTFLLIAAAALALHAQDPVFEANADIGKPKVQGSTNYDANEQSYRLKGGGYNIWFNRDEFHFLHKKIIGDFILTANMQLVGEGVDPHRKIGWMIRASRSTSLRTCSTGSGRRSRWRGDFCLRWILAPCWKGI